MGLALVTGAGREGDIGSAICRALAAAGWDVAFTVEPGREVGEAAIGADLAQPGAATAPAIRAGSCVS